MLQSRDCHVLILGRQDARTGFKEPGSVCTVQSCGVATLRASFQSWLMTTKPSTADEAVASRIALVVGKMRSNGHGLARTQTTRRDPCEKPAKCLYCDAVRACDKC